MNDEFLMTNDEGISKSQWPSRARKVFPIRHRDFLRHSTFVIWTLLLISIHAAEIPKANEQHADGTIALLATNATVHGKNIRYEPLPHKNTIGFWTRAEDWVSWDFKV